MVTKVTSSNFTSSVNSLITAAGSIPTISSIVPCNNLFAPTGASVIDPAAPFIKILGANFSSGAQVYIDSTPASSVVFVNSTQLNVTTPSISTGTFVVYVVNSDGSVAIRINGATYSSRPVWGTASTLPGNTQGSIVNIQISAVSDSTVTYTLTSGSLPTGLTLTSAGLLSGIVTGLNAQTTYNFTITATDLENQTNVSTFSITITVSDPYFYTSTLLLNGETSVTPFINDVSTNNLGLTIAGDTKPTKFSPYYGVGYYSNYFNGTTDSIKTSGTGLGATPFGYGTGDFTWEVWLYPTGASWTTANYYIFDHGGGNAGTLSYNANKLRYYNPTVGINDTVATGLVPLNVWTHVAVVRISGTTVVYVNGTQVLSVASDTRNYINNSFFLGQYGLGGNYYPGYMYSARIVKGVGVYTGTFTVPTSPLAITQSAGTNIAAITGTSTSLLVCQTNRIQDISSNNLVFGTDLLTGSGTTTITPFIPFAANSTYATYGSAYFDGTGDYLNAGTSSNITVLSGSDFTIEAWIYITANPTSYGGYYNSSICGTMPNAGNSGFEFTIGNGTSAGAYTYLVWTPKSGSALTATYTFYLNTWYHVAVSRSGAGTNNVKIFINGVQSAQGTYTTFTDNSPLTIGSLPASSYYNYFPGYIADFRFIKGTGVYTTTFTPPTAPLSAVANTQLLTLQYNGGANNYGIIDNGPFQNIITRVGNTSQGTFSPYSQTGYSTYFDGATYPGFLLNNATSTLNFALNQDFTMELWVFSTSALADYTLINLGTYKEAYQGERLIWITNSGASIYISGGTDYPTAYSCTFPNSVKLTTGVWNHIALTRQNNNIKVYLNGVGGTAVSAPGAGQPNSSRYDLAGPHGLWFGVNSTNWTGFSPTLYTGFMSNFRYVVGTALYTGNFTPPTSQLTVITNTQVLTHQSNRLKETSINAFTYTLNGTGTPGIQAVSPVSASGSYSPTVNGGSAYFDGTGDYLTTPANAILTLGTSDYTVEVWIYLTGTQTTTYGWGIVGTYPGSGTGWSLTINRSTAAQGVAWIVGGAIVLSYTTAYIPLNTWTNIAVTRSGTGTNNTKIFINGALATQGTDNTNDTFSGVTYIGGQGAAQYFTGYMSDLRVIKGYAAYTAAYNSTTTPLTSATATPASLLLNFTNGGIIDYHSSSVLETVGTVQTSPSVKKFGSASLQFNTKTDYLNIRYSIPLGTFVSDFTVECWVYPTDTSLSNTWGVIDARSAGATSGPWLMGLGSYSSGWLMTFFNGTTYNGTTRIQANTWTHCAWVRVGSTMTFYVNGAAGGTATITGTITGGATTIYIGTKDNTLAGYGTVGYIDDLRITNGFARYTAGFSTPGTFLTR